MNQKQETVHKILTKLETTHAQPRTEQPLVQSYTRDDLRQIMESHNQKPKSSAPYIIPTVREVMEDSDIINPPEVTPVIKEFNDVIPKDFPDKLPLMHDT